MLFLVEGEVQCSRYMGKTTTTKETRLVSANDANQASEKFEKYFANKTSEYDQYVTAFVHDVNEVIE